MSGVVITGAASGIGRACAQALVADGRKVALWDIAPDVAEVADGLGMASAVVDVCDSGAMETAIDAANRALGGIDGLVHAAGRVIPEPVGAYTQESWDAVLDVNRRAQALLSSCCCRTWNGPRGKAGHRPSDSSGRRCFRWRSISTKYEQASSRPRRSVGSGSRTRSPTRWHFCCHRRRRSSPAHT